MLRFARDDEWKVYKNAMRGHRCKIELSFSSATCCCRSAPVWFIDKHRRATITYRQIYGLPMYTNKTGNSNDRRARPLCMNFCLYWARTVTDIERLVICSSMSVETTSDPCGRSDLFSRFHHVQWSSLTDVMQSVHAIFRHWIHPRTCGIHLTTMVLI